MLTLLAFEKIYLHALKIFSFNKKVYFYSFKYFYSIKYIFPFNKLYFHLIKKYFHPIKLKYSFDVMFSFNKICFDSTKYFHSVKIFYSKMSHGIVRPDCIGQKFMPACFAVATFSQFHENGFEPVNNLFRGEITFGRESAVEYQ